MPVVVSCDSAQEAASPPPGNWQESSLVGVEPGTQQASPSAVIGPGQVGVALARPILAIVAMTIIVTAIATRVIATIKDRWSGAGFHEIGRDLINRTVLSQPF
jgi:hypothetical protein